MIEASDLVGVPADLANRVIAAAVAIAPCIDSLPRPVVTPPEEPDGEPVTVTDPRWSRMLAILKGVAGAARGRASATIRSQRAGSAAVDYGDSGSWFSADDVSSLLALCSAGSAPAGLPVGRFPRPGSGLSRVWPEEACDGA